AGQIDNRIGPLLRRASGVFRDHEPDGAAIRPAAILEHNEIAAARFGKLFGPLQFWAWRGLEARHLWRTDVLGACQGERGEEKSEQEDVSVIDSQGASLPSSGARQDHLQGEPTV